MELISEFASKQMDVVYRTDEYKYICALGNKILDNILPIIQNFECTQGSCKLQFMEPNLELSKPVTEIKVDNPCSMFLKQLVLEQSINHIDQKPCLIMDLCMIISQKLTSYCIHVLCMKYRLIFHLLDSFKISCEFNHDRDILTICIRFEFGDK